MHKLIVAQSMFELPFGGVENDPETTQAYLYAFQRGGYEKVLFAAALNRYQSASDFSQNITNIAYGLLTAAHLKYQLYKAGRRNVPVQPVIFGLPSSIGEKIALTALQGGKVALAGGYGETNLTIEALLSSVYGRRFIDLFKKSEAPYISASAGSVVLGKSIAPVNLPINATAGGYKPDKPSEKVSLDAKGLGLINVTLGVHYREPLKEDFIALAKQSPETPVVALADVGVLMANGIGPEQILRVFGPAIVINSGEQEVREVGNNETYTL